MLNEHYICCLKKIHLKCLRFNTIQTYLITLIYVSFLFYQFVKNSSQNQGAN